MDYQVKNIYKKIKNKKAKVSVPGSKSITARALLIATLADGISRLENVQFSDDCSTFLQCVKDLGVDLAVSGTTVKIEGCGGRLPVKSGKIYVGSAGTAARFLTALLAFSDGEYYVDSSPQMKKRPIQPLISALSAAGAKFTFHENDNSFPFTVKGTADPADEISVDVTKSSQYLSALLIAATCAGKPVRIKTIGNHGMDYVNMTLDMMWSFGVDVTENGGTYTVNGNFKAKTYEIEPDLSAACYFHAINKILGTEITVNGAMPRSMQGDGKFIEILKTFDGGRIDMSAFSDQTLTLAAVAPYLKKPTEIVNVAHIRGQECDRIKAVVQNLTVLGVKVEERADGVKIYPSQPRGGEVETFGDHRVAMAFAVLGLRADGVVIKNAEVCSKTFKDYFTVLDGLVKTLTNSAK